jgi:hypothetical protein
MSRSSRWSVGAVTFVIVMAILGTLVERATKKVAARIDGQFGYVPDPVGTARFLAELDQPLFSDAAKDVIKNAKQKDTFLYRYADRAHRQVYGKPFGPWKQGIGDCVSFGWSMGSYVGQCVDWAEGELPEPPKLVATEAIYSGSRTAGRLPPVSQAGYSDGSYGGAAARWVAGKCTDKTVGGILFRQQYPGADLTTYSPARAKEWGNVLCGGGQAGMSLAKFANKNTATHVALVRNFDEAAASLESGFCVPVCSGVGFSSQRDADGFAPRSGSWAHCMCFIAVRYAKNEGKRDGLLCMNSWGSFNAGPKWPADQPDGSFWVSRETVDAMLSGQDSFSISGVNFKYRNLDHGNWLAPAPPEKQARTPSPARLIADTFHLAH